MVAAAAGARLRRTWPQRLLISFNVLLILGCLLGASGLGYFYYRFGQLPRIAFAPDVLQPEQPAGEPQNFLLVGSDSREFVEAEEDRRSFGTSSQVGTPKADTIILVRIDPRAETAAMLSFPRDLFVPIAGTGGRNRINTAFNEGPEQLIRTISQNFNLPIHHYAQVDFAGFKNLVEAVGGVEIYLPGPVRDRDATGKNPTGLNITDSGCVELNGEQALAYVRARHFQVQEGGRWQADPTGDLGRIERQQDFIQRAIKEALSKGLTNPTKLNRLVSIGIENVIISESLDARDILDLGRRFRSLDPASIKRFSLPVEPRRLSSGAAVLFLDEVEAQPIFDVFRGIGATDEDVQPSSVQVRVLNGSGRTGEAGRTSTALQTAGFSVATPGDSRSRVRATTIRHAPGQESEARLLTRYLAGGAQIEQDDNLQGVDVVLVTGADFEGVLDTPRPADAAAPTTEPPADTTATTADPAPAPPC